MSCDFAHLDGSYVLGALSPTERREFEKHLSGCAECERAVGQLAGLPGLLARVEPDVLEAPPVAEPVPETLLPGLLRDVRRVQRRRSVVTAALAAAAASAVVVGSLSVAGALHGDRAPVGTSQPGTSTVTAPGQAMEAVGQAQVRGRLALSSVPWGTRLDLTCSYRSAGYGYASRTGPAYAMYVHTRDGRVERVATWHAVPGRTMRLAAATAASRQDITSVVVTAADGHTVLRLSA